MLSNSPPKAVFKIFVGTETFVVLVTAGAAFAGAGLMRVGKVITIEKVKSIVS